MMVAEPLAIMGEFNGIYHALHILGFLVEVMVVSEIKTKLPPEKEPPTAKKRSGKSGALFARQFYGNRR